LPELNLKFIRSPPSVGTASLILDVPHDPYRVSTHPSLRPGSRASPLRSVRSSKQLVVQMPAPPLVCLTVREFPTLKSTQLEFVSSEAVKLDSASPSLPPPKSSGQPLSSRRSPESPTRSPPVLPGIVAASSASQEGFRKQFLLPSSPSSPHSSDRMHGKKRSTKRLVPGPSLL
jgi:hypothetical protein